MLILSGRAVSYLIIRFDVVNARLSAISIIKDYIYNASGLRVSQSLRGRPVGFWVRDCFDAALCVRQTKYRRTDEFSSVQFSSDELLGWAQCLKSLELDHFSSSHLVLDLFRLSSIPPVSFFR